MRRARGKRDRRELVAAALAAVALAAASPNVAVAASDIFAKIGDIKGESVDVKHKGEINVLSWSWGVVGPLRNSPKQPQSPVGPPQPACSQDITITKLVDRASPALFAKAAAGESISKATFSMRNSGGENTQDFLVITLTDVIVTAVSQGGGGESTPTESVSLGFSSAKITFNPQSDTGTSGDAIDATVPGSCR